jgi:uncharacterized protein YukE
MKKRVSGIITLFLSFLVLTGCAGQGNAPHEYVAVYTNSELFINWAETDNKLTGQLQQASVDNNTLAVTSENYSFNGVLNGADISITLSNGITMTGTLNKNVLTLSYPANDGTGTMATIAFKPGSVTDFNQAVDGFQKQKKEKDASDADVSLLMAITEDKLDALQAAGVSFDDDMDSFGSLLKGMQSYYQFLKSYVSEQPLTSMRLDVVSQQLNVLSLRLDNIKNFLDVDSSAFGGSFGYHVQQAQALYAQLGNDITKLQQNWKMYQRLNVSDSPVSADAVSSAIGGAQKQQAALSQRIAVAQQQGDSYHSQGEKIYQTASKYVSGLTASGSN